MKKIIKRFWGVALAVILLSTMLVGAIPQAAAATLSWDYANLPGGTIGPLAAHNYNSIFAPTYWAGFDPACVIYDYAVAGDGTTIYAATSYGGFKSTDAGRTWTDLMTDPWYVFFGMDSTKLMKTDRVAVAPDNPNLVVFLNTGAGGPQFGLSTTGGTNLHVGAVTDATGTNATAITDVDICPTAVIHGQTVNLVLVSGKKASGAALYFLNYGVDFSAWDECLTSATYTTFNDHFAAGATRFVTVKHSPHFSTDYVAYLVGDNGTAPSLDIVSFNSNQFNTGVPSYQYYAAAGVPLDALHAPAVALDRADIVFDPEFVAGNEETRFTYISVDYASSPYQGGIYRVTDDAGPVVTANLMANAAFTSASSVWSIAINTDGTTLVAASGNGSATWTITAPKGAPASIAIVPSRLVKRSGGGSGEGFSSASDNQVIAFASNGVVLSRAGTWAGAFALSRDTGYTFNDISMVNFIETNIDDQLVNAATGIERYVVASGNISATGNATSVFYWDGTYWERTLTIKNTAPNGYIAEASPNNFNVLYLANMSTAMLRYTATAGRVNWLERSCPTPFTSGLADLEVQDDTTLWVATQVSGKGCVTKLSETGNIWPLGPPYYNVVFGSTLIASITLVSPNNLVAGSIAGGVSYTNDGQTWWGMFIAAIPGGGRVHATAYSLAPGSIIYATDSTTSDIYIWTIWTSLAWTKLVDVMPALTGTAQQAADLQIHNGAMYYVSYNTTTSWIGRALDPALDDTDLSEWEFNLIQYKGTTPFTQAVTSWQPDPLKFSIDGALGSGNKIWITDAAGAFLTPTPAPDQIMVFTDTLVTYIPNVTSKEEILVQVNRETGEAYNVTVSWTAMPYKYYEFEVFYDRECTHFYGSDEFYSGPNTVVDIRVGPSADADFHIYYQPGESYYYRVRVTYPYYSPWSVVHSLDVQPIRAPIPELYSPTNGGFVPDLRPGFSWSPMGFVNGGKYHFQLATDYTFTTIIKDVIVDASTVDGAGYGLDINLVDGTQYFWHVQVVEPYPGDWSTVANFRVRLPAVPTTTTQVISVPGPTTVVITQNNPPATSLTVTAPVSENVVNPSYIWAIIIIGAVLVIAVIVLIFRTRRV